MSPGPVRIGRRTLVTRLVPAGAVAVAAASRSPADEAAASPEPGRPLALVYRGRAGCTGCSEAVRAMLHRDPAHHRVAFCGPGQEVPVTSATLASASLYVQPGGGNDLDAAWRAVRPFAGALRRWVRGGGHYVGICMGGFLAGFDPGFGLFPGDSGEYTKTPGATVRGDGDALVTVRWRGVDRTIYFQGPRTSPSGPPRGPRSSPGTRTGGSPRWWPATEPAVWGWSVPIRRRRPPGRARSAVGGWGGGAERRVGDGTGGR